MNTTGLIERVAAEHGVAKDHAKKISRQRVYRHHCCGQHWG